MAGFNAGAIEASATLDRNPLTEGLRIARQQAKDFEKDPINAKIDVDDEEATAQLRLLQSRLDSIADSSPSINVDVDDLDAQAKLFELDAEIDRLDGRTININVDQDSVDAIGDLEKSASGAIGEGGSAGGGLLGIGSAIAFLAPLVAPLVGEIIGLGGALTVAGAGLGAFALVGIKDFSSMKASMDAVTKAQQELNTATTDQQRTKALNDLAEAQKGLVGPAGQAAVAFKGITDAYDKLVKDTAGPVFGVMTQAFTILGQVLPKIEPLIASTAGALGTSLTMIGTAVNGPGFTKFIQFVSGEVGSVLPKLTDILLKFGGGFASLVENSGPLIAGVLDQLDKLAGGFEKIGNSPQFKAFVDYVVQNMPLISGLFSSLVTLLGGLFVGLAPATGPVLDFLKTLADSLSTLATGGFLTDIAILFGGILEILKPLLPIMADFINAVAKQLFPILKSLGPVLKIVATVLGDVLKAIKPLLPILVPLVVAWLALNAAMIVWDTLFALSGIGTLILGIALLTVGIIELVKHWNEVVAFLQGPWGTAILGAIAIVAPFIAIPLLIITHWKTLVDFFSGVWGAITGFFSGAGDWLVSAGTQIFLGLLRGVTTAWGYIVGFFITVYQTVTGFFADAGNWLYNAGKDILQGLANGIKDAVGAAVGAVKGAVGSVVGAAKSVAKIFSPSQVFHEIGGYMMQGMANGIVAGGPLASKSMVNATKDVIGAATGLVLAKSNTNAQADQMASLISAIVGDGTPDNPGVSGGPVSLFLDPAGTQRIATVIKSTNDKATARRD